MNLLDHIETNLPENGEHFLPMPSTSKSQMPMPSTSKSQTSTKRPKNNLIDLGDDAEYFDDTESVHSVHFTDPLQAHSSSPKPSVYTISRSNMQSIYPIMQQPESPQQQHQQNQQQPHYIPVPIIYEENLNDTRLYLNKHFPKYFTMFHCFFLAAVNLAQIILQYFLFKDVTSMSSSAGGMASGGFFLFTAFITLCTSKI